MIISIVLFIFSTLLLWFAAKIVIGGVEHFSKNIQVSLFATSALILGILTSFSEISVGINSILNGRPGIYVGNLIGGSFVLIALLIPLLAIFNGGISLKHHLDKKRLLFFLILLMAPSFVILDGQVSRYDGFFLIILYALFFYLFQNSHHIFIEGQFRNLSFKKTIINISKIVGGAIGIYVASNILVNQTIVISDAMGIPTFIISIIILSLGTNLPEIMIAVNAILNKHSEIAFGDYIGSAAANPLLFGIFTVMNGPFIFEVGGINITFFILLFGYSLFYIFSRSKTRISPYEGIILIVVYVTFILFETSELFMLSPTI